VKKRYDHHEDDSIFIMHCNIYNGVKHDKKGAVDFG